MKIFLIIGLVFFWATGGNTSQVRLIPTAVFKKLPKRIARDLIKNINYLKKHNKLPPKYVTKSQACQLNWQSKTCQSDKKSKCNLGDIGKKIGGDRHENHYGWPNGIYFQADLGPLLSNQCRNKYRMIYSKNLEHIYVTNDHFKTFLRVK